MTALPVVADTLPVLPVACNPLISFNLAGCLPVCSVPLKPLKTLNLPVLAGCVVWNPHTPYSAYRRALGRAVGRRVLFGGDFRKPCTVPHLPSALGHTRDIRNPCNFPLGVGPAHFAGCFGCGKGLIVFCTA